MPYFKREEAEARGHGAAHAGASVAPRMRMRPFLRCPMELPAAMELASVLFTAEATGHTGRSSPSNMMEHDVFISSSFNSFRFNLNSRTCVSSGHHTGRHS